MAADRLLVYGPHDWPSDALVTAEIEQLAPRFIFHTGSPLIGRFLTAHPSVYGVRFDAEWSKFGESAQGRRNAQMIERGRPDLGFVLGAVWEPGLGPLDKLTGGGDMVHRLLAVGLPVRWAPSPAAAMVDLVAMPKPGGNRA